MKITPVDGEALCGHCTPKGMQKATFTELIEKGNRARLAGTCKKCGTKVNRFIAHADAGKYKGARSGGCDCPYSGSDADKKESAAATSADASDFGVMGGARRRKSRGSRKSSSRKSRKSRKSGSRKSRKSRGSRESGSRKSRKSRGSRKTGSRKSRKSRGSRK